MKLLIGIPAKEHIHTHFTHCLIGLVHNLHESVIQHEVFFQIGTLISVQRDTIVDYAIANNFTHILFLDSDMTFPEDILHKLGKHMVPIVGCNYVTRHLPRKTVAYTNLNDWESYLKEHQGGVYEVEGVGMGVMLVDVEVFRQIAKPRFPIVFKDDKEYIGEDFGFQKLARDIGYSILVDMDTSWEIGHLGLKVYRFK